MVMRVKPKATRKIATLIILALTITLAYPASALQMPFSYPAEIHAEGTMKLKEIATNMEWNLTVNTNFTALVPLFINPGSYDDVEFLGKGVVSDDSVRFSGVLVISPIAKTGIVSKGSFWVNFKVEKTTEVSISNGIYVVSGELVIIISRVTSEQPKVVWVLMKGLVTSYGDENSFGGILVHAKIGEWASVHGYFTQPGLAFTPAANYTFSFYSFRLVNTTEAELNHDKEDLYIAGFWNVYNITWTYYDHEFNLTIKQVSNNAAGELKVGLKDGVFSLGIEGLELIQGNVIYYHLKYCSPFDPSIPIVDCNGDWKVNVLDIAHVAKCYGTTFGKPGYDFFLDVNFDYIINILDLAIVAQTFGQEY